MNGRFLDAVLPGPKTLAAIIALVAATPAWCAPTDPCAAVLISYKTASIKPPFTAEQVQAIPAIRNAWERAYGVNPDYGTLGKAFDRMKAPMYAKYMTAVANGKLSNLLAYNYMSALLAEPGNFVERRTVAERVYCYVRGRIPTNAEIEQVQIQLKNGYSGYMTIRGQQQQLLQGDPADLRDTVPRAYQWGMGRGPGQGEIDTWVASGQDFNGIVENIRTYLYSPEGSADLKAMVVAYLAAYGKTASDDVVNAAVQKISVSKPVYMELAVSAYK